MSHFYFSIFDRTSALDHERFTFESVGALLVDADEKSVLRMSTCPTKVPSMIDTHKNENSYRLKSVNIDCVDRPMTSGIEFAAVAATTG